MQIVVLVWVAALLAGCAASGPTPQPDEQPPVLGATPFATALAAPSGSVISTAGYYYNDGSGAVLAGGLSFSVVPPVPLDNQPREQLWLGDAASAEQQKALHTSGTVRYAPFLATGRLEGPGSYGPSGRYTFQLASPSVKVLVPVVLTVTALLDQAFNYDGQFVRIHGTVLANADGALLFDRLDAGGVPPRTSRQLKLSEPLRDKRLLERLRTSASGFARYGEVEVEGFWRGGQLVALGIVPVEHSP